MILEFEDERGQRRNIGRPDTFDDVVRMCRNFLSSVKYEAPYWDWDCGLDTWVLDFGSNKQMIVLSDVPDGLEKELKKYYSKEQKHDEKEVSTRTV